MRVYDVVVIGAGASGLMCAIEAGKRGRDVLLIDANKTAGKKILISGGGRCNFTNMDVTKKNYISANEHFCISALKRYTIYDFLDLVDKHNIEYQEKKHGQLFCVQSSKQILTMLLDEVNEAGVVKEFGNSVTNIEKQADESFVLSLNSGEKVSCQSLVMATGGLSLPRLGATGFAYSWAEKLGLKVNTPEPALVPFTFKDASFFVSLAGTALQDCSIRCNGTEFREDMLITHRGLSGPAILQISSYWHKGDAIEIDLLPDIEISSWIEELRRLKIKKTMHKVLAEKFSKRFVSNYIASWLPDVVPAQCSKKHIGLMEEKLKRWTLYPDGTEEYATAEVTRGGLCTSEVSSKTFESNKINGLFFVGESLDVTGHLGGFNFQWAWSSGWCAGQVV